MKSRRKKMSDARFWQWFSAISDQLASDPENAEILAELDANVTALNQRFSWEIGPGRTAEWCLTISPNLDASLLADTESVIASAPLLRGWEFESTRARKAWDGRFEMERDDGNVLSLDTSDWRYVLLRYPDGAVEIVLQSKQAAGLGTDERWTAAAIVLEGLLGELALIRGISSFDLLEVFEPQLEAKAKPISQLSSSLNVLD